VQGGGEDVRVEVADPADPAEHVARRDGETGVEDEGEDEEGGRDEGLRQRARQGADRAEEHAHDEGEGEGNK